MQPIDVNFENTVLNDFDNNHELIFNNFDRMKSMGDKRPPEKEAVDLIRPGRDSKCGARKRKKPEQGYQKECISCSYILSVNDTTCPECAICQPEIFVDPTADDCKYKYAFKQNHNPPCAYKRINHFNEKMAQFQGKEKTQLPQDLIDNVNNEIDKYKICKESIKPTEIRQILKKLKCSKYYEHVNYITHLVGSYQLPYLSQTDEERMRMMFFKIQTPFYIHAPENRKNFLNYAYIFRKFLELLSLDQHLVNFSELKSRDKLYEQDRIWKLICKDLDWEFIPSI
tara:strand:+ start:22 stop:873 length:852 start_codon:yes stop_codon:yes gene_type:complete